MKSLRFIYLGIITDVTGCSAIASILQGKEMIYVCYYFPPSIDFLSVIKGLISGRQEIAHSLSVIVVTGFSAIPLNLTRFGAATILFTSALTGRLLSIAVHKKRKKKKTRVI